MLTKYLTKCFISGIFEKLIIEISVFPIRVGRIGIKNLPGCVANQTAECKVLLRDYDKGMTTMSVKCSKHNKNKWTIHWCHTFY